MADYSLAGSGTQALTVGTGALRVHVTAIPPLATNGRAFPLNLYDVGLIRQGDGTDWWRAEAIDAEHMLIPLLQGMTEIGYALLHGATIDVTEVIGTSPFYPPPVSAGASLAYQSAHLGADLALSSSVWTDVLTHSLGAGTWLLFGAVQILNGGATDTSAAKFTDGVTDDTSAEASNVANGANDLHITSEPIVLTVTTTWKLQAKRSGTAGAKASGPYIAATHATYFTALQIVAP